RVAEDLGEVHRAARMDSEREALEARESRVEGRPGRAAIARAEGAARAGRVQGGGCERILRQHRDESVVAELAEEAGARLAPVGARVHALEDAAAVGEAGVDRRGRARVDQQRAHLAPGLHRWIPWYRVVQGACGGPSRTAVDRLGDAQVEAGIERAR